MKKILAILMMIIIMTITLVGCGQKEIPSSENTTLNNELTFSEKVKNLKVDDIIKFGKYVQYRAETDGRKEDIEWIVLEIREDKALLLSKYALDGAKYNEKWENTIWSTSPLRTWLNDDFFNQAFSDEEKTKIPTVTIPADANPDHDTPPGDATQDKIFLLSIIEVNKYLNTDIARQCIATDYAKERGVNARYYNNVFSSSWWLRTPGRFQYNAAVVAHEGVIANDGIYVNYFRAVRPALWIELS